ncbi:hypothetical protein GOODEAATRI_009029 [Goodea atripinnis]|uniref:FERM domain-containing protein n=1 Tax=Goodea atripinnis TaxID=208336 RepID=A0ABV0PWJ5_9TELE
MLFQWKQLENLYFREKKFAVEVNNPHRRAVTKRTFGQTGLVIHSWYASHSLIKTIWAMAISQHQFYLDMKQTKSNMTTTRSSGDIAVDLTVISAPKISKLSSVESNDPLIMASNGSLISTGSADSEVSEEQKKEKIAELKKKEKDLQDALTQKLEELKKICMREAELTGKLPKEYPLATGEKPPQVRRRVGAAFKLDDLNLYDEEPHLRNLESKRALQQRIVEAADKLAKEDGLDKTLKRKRRHNHLDSIRKLDEIEKEINNYRMKIGRKPTQRTSIILADDVQRSDLSSLSDSLTLDDETAFVVSIKTVLLINFDYLCRLEDASQHSHQRSGSLESLSQLMMETKLLVPSIPVSPSRRCNSTEVIDDGSSHTSQSSVEYSAAGNHTHRRRARGRHRKDQYTNTGSMPNLAQPDTRCYAYQPQGQPTTTAYYVTGYPNYVEPEPYSSRVYMYEDEIEGHYNVNPSYHHTQAAYYSHDVRSQYASDGIDVVSHNVYATLRPPRNRPAHHSTEQVSKNIQRALVAEHLKGWYQRKAPQKQGMYNCDYDRGSQQGLSYQSMPAPYPQNHRNVCYSSGWSAAPCVTVSHLACSVINLYHFSPASSASSSGNWCMSNRGMSDNDMPVHESLTYSYSAAPYSHPAHSRSATSKLLKGCWYSPDSQRRCTFSPTSPSSSSIPPYDSSLSSSSYSPGCRVRQVVSGPAQQQLPLAHRLRFRKDADSF